MTVADHHDAPDGKSQKYARIERERRFLLTTVPDLSQSRRTVRIVDRYLRHTRLRLRKAVETFPAAGAVVYKLTQKVAGRESATGLITTIYLSEREYRALDAIPADGLEKTRYSFPPLGIDVFDGPLRGLVLAEAEFEHDAEMRAFAVPETAVEVTRDPRFAGGALAVTTSQQLDEVVTAVLAGR